MLGHIMEWFYGDLAGIRCDPDAVAFKKIIIRPTPIGDVTWAKASYESARGTISSEWKRSGGRLTMALTIPPNTTATVYVPTSESGSVTEGGKPASAANGVKFLRKENQCAVYEVGSGAYQFSAGP